MWPLLALLILAIAVIIERYRSLKLLETNADELREKVVTLLSEDKVEESLELCDAARDHSKDMSEKNFFAHESPVKGKTTPWDRAANFGTTASGENIYAGSTDPHGANTGWFYSPGHHKNMFNPGQKRIGLGQFKSHWTQMFGR